MPTRPFTDSGYDDEWKSGAGWLFFAGTVLGIAGLMRIVDSIWAFSYHGVLPDHLQDAVLGSQLSHYAWLWLGVGIVLVVASFAVLAQSQVARWTGIFAGVLGAVSAMFWMPYYPVWSLMYIGLAVLTIYALVAHGGRQAA